MNKSEERFDPPQPGFPCCVVVQAFFMKLLGLRLKRNIVGKEVIINDPDYSRDAERLEAISNEATNYAHGHKLMLPPNPIKVFFEYEPDHEIERISDELEEVLDDLTNTRDRLILTELNHYPILSVKAHTRPFERRWLNVISAIIVPLGIIFYIRMWRFRLRLLHDLRTIKQTNTVMVNHIREKYTHI